VVFMLINSIYIYRILSEREHADRLPRQALQLWESTFAPYGLSRVRARLVCLSLPTHLFFCEPVFTPHRPPRVRVGVGLFVGFHTGIFYANECLPQAGSRRCVLALRTPGCALEEHLGTLLALADGCESERSLPPALKRVFDRPPSFTHPRRWILTGCSN
jgi:hypothetical protein